MTDQLTYIKKLNTLIITNADAIAKLSGIVRDNIVKFHDEFQKITRDILWLNVTVYGQSQLYMAV